jgi:hypothetical protein
MTSWGRLYAAAERRALWITLALAAVGFLLRWAEANRTFLHPDEAMHLHLALPSSVDALFQASAEAHHPPLLTFLLHAVLWFGRSEPALRLPMVVAGSLVPLVFFLWLRRHAGDGAAVAGAAILALSPSLIALSAQMRAYSIALLLCAAALRFFDDALERGSAGRMALFSAALWLAILAEYSAAWFAAGAGVYALVRFFQTRPRLSLAAVWGVSQAGGLALYAALYFTVLAPHLDPQAKDAVISSYLRHAFPQPGQNFAAFFLQGTLDQFAFLFYAAAAAIPAALLYLFGSWLLIRTRRAAVAALCTLPLPLVCAAAIAGLFPYGRTRHTAILALFLAAAIGVSVDAILRSRHGWIFAAAGAAALAFTAMQAAPALIRLHATVQRGDALVKGLAYLRANVPSGSPLLTDRKSALVLHYYLCGPRMAKPANVNRFTELDLCEYRAFTPDWSISTPATLLDHLPSFRRRYSIAPGAPVWVLDAGFDLSALDRLPAEAPHVRPARASQFDGALALFQLTM